MSAINLDQKGISVTGPEFNAIAPNLQSNILKSHSRDNACLLFLTFTAGKSEVAVWLKKFFAQQRFVLSGMDQKVDSAAHKATPALKSKTVTNFYLTASGCEHLGFNSTKFKDSNTDNEPVEEDEEVENDNTLAGNSDFVSGMKSKKVIRKLKDPDVNEWEQGYNTNIHALVLLADDEASVLETEFNNLKISLADIAVFVKEEIEKI